MKKKWVIQTDAVAQPGSVGHVLRFQGRGCPDAPAALSPTFSCLESSCVSLPISLTFRSRCLTLLACKLICFPEQSEYH